MKYPSALSARNEPGPGMRACGVLEMSLTVHGDTQGFPAWIYSAGLGLKYKTVCVPQLPNPAQVFFYTARSIPVTERIISIDKGRVSLSQSRGRDHVSHRLDLYFTGTSSLEREKKPKSPRHGRTRSNSSYAAAVRPPPGTSIR